MSNPNTPSKTPQSEPAQDRPTTTRYASVVAPSQQAPSERPTDSPRQQSRPEIRRDYGTSSTVGGKQARVQSVAETFPESSPQAARARRPSVMRRVSTKKTLPHRGEQFSVDDDPSEIEEDLVHTLTRVSTVRRRTIPHIPQLAPLESRSEDDEDQEELPISRVRTREVPVEMPEPEEEDDLDDADDEGEDLSDAESFTLRDRQLAINQTHPFGIRIWKPALYKKNRSVEKSAEEDIHSSPSQIVSVWLWIFNGMWTLFFGWWLALAAAAGALVCFIFAFDPSAAAYGRVFWGLSGYLFWPFGKFVKLEQDDNYADEDEGEGRSISEYERWQAGDLEYGRLMFGPPINTLGSIVGRRRNSVDSETTERDNLLGRNGRSSDNDNIRKRRLFGRGQWTLGRVIFFIFFYFNVAPLMLTVSLLCWFMVFWIPMGRVLMILIYHFRKRPLALTFHADASHARHATKPSSILLCTYRAAGLKYWKWTVDGTNIFLINFLAVVVFVVLDYFVLKQALGVDIWLTSPALLFIMALVSVIPLAYFIGQAVASISAQSSMGMGAAVNAFFSTIVEVYLYCIALNEGKGKLVEGSIIGSIFAGVLLLPGLSMCFGAIKRKTQRFNVKSASATSTLLLFATIAAFGPTLFYKIYGSHELICKTCNDDYPGEERDCRQCYFRQTPAINDEFFVKAVRPYCWAAAVLLFSSYIIGLLFTLRTHAAVIWTTDIDEKKPIVLGSSAEQSPLTTRVSGSLQTSGHLPSQNGSYVPRSNIRESQLYKKILGHSLRQAGLPADGAQTPERAPSIVSTVGSQPNTDNPKPDLPHVVPPNPDSRITSPIMHPVVPGLTEEENINLVRQVAEMAATAATVAARDAVQHPRTATYEATHSEPLHPDTLKHRRPSTQRVDTSIDTQHAGTAAEHAGASGHDAGGHDAPNWSRTKSSVVLLTATVAYAMVAEVLVNTVDVVLQSVDIDEKFLGITLFALVPNTTEFLNAISFAMNGNIALSMEIGSAYALQVILLQIPALVLFSAMHGKFNSNGTMIEYTFNLIFPQWDMVTVILCVFLLSYLYNEGKSNYFKGSILVLTYLVVVMGFYYSGYTTMDVLGVDPGDTLALMTSSNWQSRAGSSRQHSSSIGRREL